MNEANQLRDEGIVSVTNHQEAGTPGWMGKAHTLLRTFGTLRRAQGKDFVCEDFKAWALTCDLPDPVHENAWGAMWRHAARLGIIKPSGGFRACLSPTSHGRYVRAWTLV